MIKLVLPYILQPLNMHMSKFIYTVLFLFTISLQVIAQSPTIEIDIHQIDEYYNAAGDSIEHSIFLSLDIDYGMVNHADIRQLDFDLKIADYDDVDWYLNRFDLGLCNGQTGFSMDTTGFAMDSIVHIQVEFANGVDTSEVCRFRAIAMIEVVLENQSSNNLQRSEPSSPINNECSFRKKADVFIVAIDPVIMLADNSTNVFANDTLSRRLWLKTCGLPDMNMHQYDTHFEIVSYTNTTVLIELMMRYNDDYLTISGEDTLYFSTGNIRFFFDDTGLANPTVIDCDGCAAYTTTGSAGNLVSFNYEWLTNHEIATKKRLALIEFDVIEDIEIVCARLIYNEPPVFPYTRVFAFDNTELETIGFDIITFCPKEFVH